MSKNINVLTFVHNTCTYIVILIMNNYYNVFCVVNGLILKYMYVNLHCTCMYKGLLILHSIRSIYMVDNLQN